MKARFLVIAAIAAPVAAYAQSSSPPLTSVEVCLGDKDQQVVAAALAEAHAPPPPIGCFSPAQYGQAVQALAMASPAIAALLKANTAAQTAAQIAAQEAGLASEKRAQTEAQQRVKAAADAAKKPPERKP